jgi:hypothetical protein
MATGSTADFALTRNEIIASAIRKCKAWPEDGNMPVHKIRDAIRALNLILRQEDLKQTGLAKSNWALSTVALPLVAGRYIFSSDEDLPNILELQSVTVRGTDGDDSVPIDIISADDYSALSPKNETGDPTKVYLRRARLLEDQRLYVWPAPSSVTAGDSVIQSEVTYTCILKHTSATENKPGSGASADLYWKAGDTATGSADTWATATEYDNGDLIILNFKRPLYDFDTQYDNPDMPLGWEDYLIYKLAVRLAPEYDLGMEQRTMLKMELADIERELVPAAREKTNQTHNLARFF